jgi:hypothetical protein
MSAKGVFDKALFAEYRSLPASPRKRLLAGRLIEQNEPLLMTLVAQMCGRSTHKIHGRRPAAARLAGLQGLDQIEPDDAMQAGRIAMMKALDSFDPTKASFAYYVSMKLRHELQRIEVFELHIARAPEGKGDQRPHVGFVGMPTDPGRDALDGLQLAYLHASGDAGGIVDSDITPADVSRWQATGLWPVSLEAWMDEKAHAQRPTVAYSIPAPVLTGWDAFLQRCRFAPAGRVDVFSAWSSYVNGCRAMGERELSRAVFVSRLQAKSVRRVAVRVGATVQAGLAGLRLVTN